MQTKAYVLLLALFEGQYQEAIDMVVDRLDPNVIYKLLCNYTKRLYIQTKYNSPEKVKELSLKFSLNTLLMEGGSKMSHYTRKKFDDDEEADVSAMDKSKISSKSKKNIGKNQFFTQGDASTGDLGADDSYNLWLKAPKNVKKYLTNVYKISSSDE